MKRTAYMDLEREEKALSRAEMILAEYQGREIDPSALAMVTSDLAQGITAHPAVGRRLIPSLLAQIQMRERLDQIDEGTLANVLTAAQLSLLGWPLEEPAPWLEGVSGLIFRGFDSGITAATAAENFLWTVAGTRQMEALVPPEIRSELASRVQDNELRALLV